MEIALAWHVLRGQVTVFLMSDYKTILYHTPQWRKRLVNKKRKPCQLMVQSDSSWLQEDNSWRKTTVHGPGKPAVRSYIYRDQVNEL
jgi:hypothetical protein